MNLLIDYRKDKAELIFVVEITQRWEDVSVQSLQKTLPDEGRKVRKTLKMQERQKERTAWQDWAGEANPHTHCLQEQQSSWWLCKHLKNTKCWSGPWFFFFFCGRIDYSRKKSVNIALYAHEAVEKKSLPLINEFLNFLSLVTMLCNH